MQTGNVTEMSDMIRNLRQQSSLVVWCMLLRSDFDF